MATSDAASSIEQEKYLSEFVAATPLSVVRQGGTWGMSDSNLSIDSLVLAADEHLQTSLTTPETNRRSNPFNKAIGTLGYITVLQNQCW